MTAKAWWISGALALLALLGLALVASGGPLEHDDLFLHAHTGAFVLEHHSVPRADPFSYTRRGYPWTSHEWGFGLIVHLLQAAFGIAAWSMLKRALGLAVALLLAALAFRAIPVADRRAAPLIVPVVVALGLFAGAGELVLRAALLTTVFLGLELLVLGRVRREQRIRAPAAIALVVLFGVWANVHSGVVFGLGVLLLPVVESLLARAVERDHVLGLRLARGPDPAAWTLLWLAVVAVVLLNANGYDTLTYPFRLNAYLYGGRAFDEIGHFSTTTPSEYPGYFVLLGALAAAVATGWRRGRLHLGDLVGVVAFAFLAHRSHRFSLDLTMLAAAPLAAGFAGLVPARLPRWAPVAPAAVAVGAALFAYGLHRELPRERLAPTIAVGAGEVLATPEVAAAPGRLYNHQNFGGYLGWRLHQPVFADGRNLVFETLPRPAHLRPLATRLGVRKLAIAEREYTRFAMKDHLDAWACVYWDDVAAVFLARQPGLERYIAEHEFRLVPAFGPPDETLFESAEGRAALRAELERAIEGNPANQRALLVLANVELAEGDHAAALEALQRAAAIRPRAELEHEMAELEAP